MNPLKNKHYTASVSNSANVSYFEFAVPNTLDVVLVGAWCWAMAYDTVALAYSNVGCLMDISNENQTVAMADSFPTLAMGSGALGVNGKKIYASDCAPWYGESTLPAGRIRVTFTVPFVSVNVTTYSCYCQLFFK